MVKCNQKAPIPVTSTWQVRSDKAKKRISINTTTSVHLPKPVSTDLTVRPDSVLINPIGKDGA